MDLKVVQGKWIKLPADLCSGDEPTDPDDLRVTVVNPSGTTVVKDAVPVREEVGLFRYDYHVAAGAPAGTWEAMWTATCGGQRISASDLFEVLEAPVAAHPIKTEADSIEPPIKSGDSGPGTEANRKITGEPVDSASLPAKRESRRFPWGKTLLIIAASAVLLASIWFISGRADTVQSKIDRGAAAQKAGRTDEAEQLYREVLAANPDNKLALFNLGVAAQAAGRLEDAEPYYLKALTTDPAFLPALFNLAILQERLGRYDETEQTYRRILEMSPESVPAYVNLGYLLAQKMGRPEEARTMFGEAVKVDPAAADRIPPDLRPAADPPASVEES